MRWRRYAVVGCDRGVALLMGGLLAICPLAFGGEIYWARAAIQLVAALVGGLWAVRSLCVAEPAAMGAWQGANRWPAWCAAVLVVLIVAPLVPIPPGVLGCISPAAFHLFEVSLPGWPDEVPFRSLFEAGSEAALSLGFAPMAKASPGWRPTSIVPDATLATLSLGAAYVVLGAAAAAYPWRQNGVPVLRRLTGAVIAVAVLEAAYAIWQQTSGVRQVYWYGCPDGVACLGTHLNRNHFAGFLEMAVPVLAALALQRWFDRPAGLLQAAGRAPAVVRILRAAGTLAEPARAGAAMLAAGALVMLGSLAASGSRAALVTTVTTAAAMTPLLPAGIRWNRRGVCLAGVVLLSVAALWLTVPQLRGRMVLDDPSRRGIVADALTMAVDFPVFGVGAGNFGAAYPLYRASTPSLWAFKIEHAHNDYVQWVAEAGVPAAVLSFVLFGLWARRVLAALRSGRNGQTGAWLRWGFAAGAMALLLHSLVDYNLHVPANALVFAVWVGAAYRLSRPAEADVSRLPGGGPGRWSKAIAVLAVVACAAWAGTAWERWQAEAEYHRVYPAVPLEDLTLAGRSEAADSRALDALRGAVAVSPSAPALQAGLGREIVRRRESGGAERGGDAGLRAAAAAYAAALWQAPVSGERLLDAARAAAPLMDGRMRGELVADVATRVAALARYDPGVAREAAEWAQRIRDEDALEAEPGG